MAKTGDQSVTLERVTSGISGLDQITRGGFIKGGTYLVMGFPGTGKTILGNQFCYHHVAQGGRALYLTLLAETHSRMLRYMQVFSFFESTPLGDALHYLNGYTALEQEGLDGLMTLIRRELRKQKASALVIDGAISSGDPPPTSNQWKQFLYELHGYTETIGCTTLLLTHTGLYTHNQPEHTMVDGLIELRVHPSDMRTVRELQVHKFRGSNIYMGQHNFEITGEGIIAYPRTESILATTTYPTVPAKQIVVPGAIEKLATGIQQLDEMMSGGLPTGSATVLMGPSGTGKTSIGLYFLHNGLKKQQSALYLGFNETPEQILRRMNHFGLSLPSPQADSTGQLEFIYQPPIQDVLDILAEQLLEVIERNNIKRLFIDGLSGFQNTIATDERLMLFFTALTTYLRERGITTIYATDLPDILSNTVATPGIIEGLSALAENLLLLRRIELHSQLYRLISIMKMRGNSYDPSVREFRITQNGVEVASTFMSAETILTKGAHPRNIATSPSQFATDTPSAREEQS